MPNYMGISTHSFVCFILRFRFPLCPRPHGPIGTPLTVRTIEGCLLLGVSSQPYVVFMGIDPWAHQSEHWQFARLYNFILRMCGIAQSYNWYVTLFEISNCKVAWFVTSYRTRNPHRNATASDNLKANTQSSKLEGATSRSWCSSIEIS